MSHGQAAIPSQPRAKALRACLLCSLVQTPADFRKHGCPNCEELMGVGVTDTSFHGGHTNQKPSPFRNRLSNTQDEGLP